MTFILKIIMPLVIKPKVSPINRTINNMSYDQIRDTLFELMNNNLEELDNETLEVFVDSWQPDLLES